MTSPPEVVTLIASLNARHGFAIEQLNAVLAVRPSDATNVRWAGAALSRRIDPPARSTIQLRIDLLAANGERVMTFSPWSDGQPRPRRKTRSQRISYSAKRLIRISAPPGGRRRRRRRRDSKAGNVTQSNPSKRATAKMPSPPTPTTRGERDDQAHVEERRPQASRPARALAPRRSV